MQVLVACCCTGVSKLWVMNVVPFIADTNTLGVIYERGLIGMYHDWCEGFSTYPRTYDLIHANGVFSLYQNKCKFEDILLEMDRILRPEGAVIIRDTVDALVKVEKIANAMRWETTLADHEGALVCLRRSSLQLSNTGLPTARAAATCLDYCSRFSSG
ncbi:putative methyltransferase PMT2 [Hordeum vulgare]|nr:putative methyltransferase PMT2 [Hordeum vulgare]